MSRYEGFVEKRILEAAKTLFAEKGHEETRLREIAATARTSESQVIKYFESKAGILEALIGEARILINDSFEKAQKNTEDPILTLEKLPTLIFDLFDKEPELIKVYLFSRRYYALITEEQLLPEVQFRAKLGEIFKSGQKSKIFRDDFNPYVATSAFWGAILGIMRDKLYSARSADFPGSTRKELTMVINTIITSFVRK